MQLVEIDMSNMKDFVKRMEQAANSGFREELEILLDALGDEYLRILQDEIIRLKVVDTRELLNSFHKFDTGGGWKSGTELTLEVGSNLVYAQWVNDGHHQQPGRFIPGEWQGDRFVYQPGAESGMVLKKDWVEGKHFIETSLAIMERKVGPAIFEKKVQEWLNSYFRI